MHRTTLRRLAWTLLLTSGVCGCKRSTGPRRSQPPEQVAPLPRDVLCVEQPEGCLYCSARDVPAATFLDADQSRPTMCDPKDEDDCVEFCTDLAPECALPWSSKPRCVLGSELEFQRAVFNRDTSGHPEVQAAGRVVDESGRRIEGARVDVWVSYGVQLTALAQETTGKDGTFRLRLRSGPWSYSLRFSRTGLANEITDRIPAEKLAAATGNQPRTFRMGPESAIKGRVVDSSPAAEPVGGAVVTALRTLEDGIESSSTKTSDDGGFVLGGLNARRYFLRITKFGWRPQIVKPVLAGAGGRVLVKLARATVIRGAVHDKEGEPEPSATVAAVLSDVPGVPTTPIFWATDSAGEFAQDRFAQGTYYLWARKGDWLAYPPQKIELPDGSEVEVILSLRQKGAKVTGQVLAQPGYRLSPGARALLLTHSSPLAFPRPAVANLEDKSGRFEFAGILPGRYEINIRDGTRTLAIVAGPREIEVPIDADVTVQLKEAITVRPRIGE